VKEKKIDLKKIDHSKDKISEALGISQEEFRLAMKEVFPSIGNAAAKIIKNFSMEELSEAIERYSLYSEAIVFLWSKKKRTYLTLEEFVATLFVLQRLKELKEKLENIVRMVLFTLFRDEEIALVLTPLVALKAEEEKEIFEKIVKLIREKGAQGDEELEFIKIDLLREIERFKPSVHPEIREEFEECLRRWKEGMIQKILNAKNIQELKKVLLS
jgi:hypothetical protein